MIVKAAARNNTVNTHVVPIVAQGIWCVISGDVPASGWKMSIDGGSLLAVAKTKSTPRAIKKRSFHDIVILRSASTGVTIEILSKERSASRSASPVTIRSA
ncbi:MAG: hypothetical protein ACRET0_06580 [Steroidobacteraceae bacterium]